MTTEPATHPPAPSEPPQLVSSPPRRYRAVAWAVGAGLLFTAGAFFGVRQSERIAFEADLERRGDHQQRQFEVQITERIVSRAAQRLRSTAKLVAELSDLDRDGDWEKFAEFRRYTRSSSFSSYSLFWVRRVAADQVSAYERSVQEGGRRHFTVRPLPDADLGGGTRKPAELFPVHFVEPPALKELLLGADLGSDLTLREALDRACDTGQAALAGRVPIAGPGRHWNQWLQFLPVYTSGSPPMTVQERRRRLRGFVGSMVRVKADPVGSTASGGIDFVMFQPTAAVPAPDPPRATLKTERWRLAGFTSIAGFRSPKSSQIRDQPWSFQVRPRRELVEERPRWFSLGVLGLGLVATTLMGLYVRQSVGREERIASLVEERTAQLLQAREEERNLRTEAQLLTAHKMEAIGNLAGGIAHDFNNLLTGILGSSELLRLNAKPGDPNLEIAEIIERAAQRATELTQQLLGFARRGKHQDAPVNLHDAVHEVVALLSRTLDKKITIHQDLKADLSLVRGDPTQLQQVILNLAVNARDAMPDGGELRFETAVIKGPDPAAALTDGEPSVPFFRLSVSDDGCGIVPEIEDRIFEPFFTTKPPGQGTGMGLAMVYGIVKNHEGTVTVDSEVGVGTRFQVDFPLLTTRCEKKDEIGLAPGAQGPIRGEGRILLVDDEATVRHTGSEMLRALGYDVVTAQDGEEAVEIYSRNRHGVDLVILDMIMPKMGGSECFQVLKKINPDIRAILSTGYGQDGAAQEILDAGMVGFCQKPYRIRYLSEVVQKGMAPQLSVS